MCKLRARSSLFAQFVELWLLGIEGPTYFSIEWFILLLSRSLSMLVLEFRKDQFILFLYFLSFFSDKLFKENKCENHTQCHRVSNKAKKIFFISFYFRFFIYFFFRICFMLFIHFYFLCKWSSLLLFSSFHWTVFVVFNLSESHYIYTGFMKLTIFNVFLTLFVIAELIQLS